MFERLSNGQVVYRQGEEWASRRGQQINFAKRMRRVLVRLSAAQQCYTSSLHRKVTHWVAMDTVKKSKCQESHIDMIIITWVSLQK